MELRNSESAINLDVKSKADILHGTGKLDSAESMFLKCYKGSEENVQSTCFFRDAENTKVQKERKRLEQFHNMDDATLNKYRKYDGLEEFNTSKQSSFNCELESTLLKDNKTSCEEIEENIKSYRFTSPETSFNNFPVNQLNQSDSVNAIEVLCPICNKSISVENHSDKDLAVNKHIDICLNNRAISDLGSKPQDTPKLHNNLSLYDRDLKLQNISTTSTSNLSTKTKSSKSSSILKYMVNKG